ncbi:hypothetical protein BBN63_21285 [Streptomyces niveus]|uniref:Integral membrane protein n=1 Tax=Streptomyces niveus TaxID=193462 RepID=A0A1U9QX29_STRNV|nr:hypothetical protein BBN63_21285 [Streptomyces niveus]
MGRAGQQSLARVTVIVRAGAAPMWWLGILAAAPGALIPGLTGRWAGLYIGAALFVLTAAVVAVVRRRRYDGWAEAASRAGKFDYLQDRSVTLRVWRRARVWWLVGGFLAAVALSFAVPVAGGAALAGAGAGLWLKALLLGRRERAGEELLWVRTDWAGRGSPVGEKVKGFRTTGLEAGDAAPGGARRPRVRKAGGAGPVKAAKGAGVAGAGRTVKAARPAKAAKAEREGTPVTPPVRSRSS